MSKQPINILVCSLLLIACAGSQFASAECGQKLSVDSDKSPTVGPIILGSDYEHVAKLRNHADECVIDEDNNYVDCEFYDDNGVAYLVEGNQVIRTEIRRGLVSDDYCSVFGLTLSDNIMTALRKISNDDDGAEIRWTVVNDGNSSIVLATGFSFTNELSVDYGIYIVLSGKGDIETIGSRLNW